MCCKAEASACAPEEPILLPDEDKWKTKKQFKIKLNKEEFCCKAEASACEPEEPILLSEDAWKRKKRKENMKN